jgi:hypothetical protein
VKWPEWLTYCPRGMTRAEWKAEFERSHLPKYKAQERRLKQDVEDQRLTGSACLILAMCLLVWLAVLYDIFSA